ncbi:AAA family ATPase [Frankia sp. QA3]|uniref:AAA family ATPase n=1 Tax=Frankia sp. QA3 TaxID=710111 RepID=UPI000269B8A7|nr:AAA family ATPase [Frankia sp. QA3]EIV90804.1 hypothetical protein FraQA3DRAFT_0207 [Frankia sp. QA3]
MAHDGVLAPVPTGAGAFVGRREELALLARLTAKAAAERRQVVVVSGEAGIGKTYLCERAAAQAEQAGFRVEWGRCWPYGGAPPLWPWPAVLAAVLAAVSGMPGGHPLAEGLGDESAAPERFTRFQAVADLLTRRLTDRPTMIVLDDVHTADAPPASTIDPASAIGAGGCEGRPTGQDLARTVLAITGGNPLFVSRVVAHGSPQAGLAGVEQAVADSIDRLDADGRRTLALAAVLGRTVAVHDVAALAGRPVDAVLDALAEARRVGLVEPEGADRFRFGHDVILSAAAATLRPRERLDAHATAAALIGASDRADRLTLRAHHALQAAARSGEDAQRAVVACRAAARYMRRGFDYQQAAALLDAAVAVSDPWPAAAGRAALLVERAEAILACGRLSAAREAFARAADAVDGADDPNLLARAALGLGGVWLNEHRDPIDRRRVLALQRAALGALADPARAAEGSGAASDPSRRQGASLRGRLAVRLAAESVYDGATPARALAALAEVRATGDAPALAEALSLTHHAMLGPEHNLVKLALVQELLTVAASAGDGMLALLGLLWRTVDLFHLGDARAERSLAELRVRADALACQSVLYIVAAMDVMRLVRAGRLAQAAAAAGTVLEFGLAVGDADAEAFYGAQLASIRWMQGRDGELLDLAAEAAASPTLTAGDFAFAAGAAMMAARAGRLDEARAALHHLVALALGDADAAVRHHERAVAANRRFGNRPGTALSQVDLADALTTRAGSGRGRGRCWPPPTPRRWRWACRSAPPSGPPCCARPTPNSPASRPPASRPPASRPPASTPPVPTPRRPPGLRPLRRPRPTATPSEPANSRPTGMPWPSTCAPSSASAGAAGRCAPQPNAPARPYARRSGAPWTRSPPPTPISAPSCRPPSPPA